MLSAQRSTIVSNTRSQLRVNSELAESIVDGPGIRYAVFVQGCPHHCEGCHNPQTHSFDDGYDADIVDIFESIKENPILEGVTFSGGEPFCQAGPLAELAEMLHDIGLDVMVYSGWTLDELIEKAKKEKDVAALLRQADIIVDGPFILEQRNLDLDFRGSDNQKLIYMSEVDLPDFD